MSHDMENTLALLQQLPSAVDALLRSLPDFWTRNNEGGETYSPFVVVAHLIHAERMDWIPRVKCILEHGESRELPRFDRDPDEAERLTKSLPQLLDEFAELRAKNIEQLRSLNLQPADLARRGRHPRFGVVTLSQLLATWAAHDLTHLHQISRTMAYQYREAVGPWTAFLGVMHCNGHSEA
ncbi:MAG: DinB family protein [Acidobacteriales bacterium]|nr:DinB family protein [Terriglobales bacterium]